MKLLTKIAFCLTVIFYLNTTVSAKDVVQESEYCAINWSDGFIQCQGESESGQKKFRAKRAAVVIAQRNLLELIKGVSIDSETTIKDGMLESDVIRSKVSGVVKGAQIVSNKYDKAEQSAISKIKIHMGKDLRTALGGNDSAMSDKWRKKLQNFFTSFNFGISTAHAKEAYTLQDQETINKLMKDFKESKDNISLNYLETIIKDIKSNNYSGLLIDARDVTDLKPALTVKLVNNKGKEIYPGKYVDDSAFIGRNGVSVGMDFDIEDARKNKRVFATPLELKGESTYKSRKSDIVLSDDSLKKLQITIAALKKAKVIVVVPE
ncbi:MAG: hypothetical protein HQL46_15125 [Gammaproteobacteria bacterium]|nr:hypothetical protein [Gammaproteobacteria bacterium]